MAQFGPTNGYPGAPGSWGICDALRLELHPGKPLVWGTDDSMAALRRAELECISDG